MPERIDLGYLINESIKSSLADMHTATIGRVVAVHDKTIDVQPVLNRQIKGKSIRLPVFSQVPPVFLQGGGSYQAFPIAKGDYCMLIFMERCFDSWYNGQDEVSPLEYRMHDYSDGFAIVGINNIFSSISIPAVIQQTGDTNQDGNYTHQGNRIQTGNHVQTGNFNLTGDMGIDGNLSVDGDIICTGEITCSDIIVDGVSFNSHVHGGVETGGGTTGVPQ